MEENFITKEDDEKNNIIGGIDVKRLTSFIQRIENLEEEKKEISDDIKDVYAEAKYSGFDTKAIKEIIKLRKIDEASRDERDIILSNYKEALGL